MKLKLFGKNIFEFTKNTGAFLFNDSSDRLRKAKHLPDFYSLTNRAFDNVIEIYTDNDAKKIEKKRKKKALGIQLTPKAVYEMKMLNDENVKINTDEEYVNEQLEQFKDKLSLIKKSNFDMSKGTLEISSILIRLENRKKYSQVKDFFEGYAYTTTIKINNLIKKHNYLKMGQVEQFLADMPKEAIGEMKEYEKVTKKMCGKKPLFYIIASKKDFEGSDNRRDPILLAQSPFTHNWQILGAWDKEMLLLEEL